MFKGNTRKMEPASAAIIMANGIFLIGTVELFPFLDVKLGKYLAAILVIVSILIYFQLSVQLLNRNFRTSFLKHPVNSFAFGTWVAGISVLCDVFLKYYPEFRTLTQVISVLNTIFWLFFMFVCIRHFKLLLAGDKNEPVHGIILLSTVATQSIVVLLANAFSQVPLPFSRTIIVLGMLFYVVGIILILKRYLPKTDWSLADDWANTNCIIHGALSITGLAIVTTNAFSSGFVMYFWIVVFMLLLIIECVEVVRGWKRIKLYGIENGIFTYNVTQWSRNFTFGMFLTFTLIMHRNPFNKIPEGLARFQEGFLSIWAWIVLVALIMEMAIYVRSFVEFRGIIHERHNA